MTLVGVINQVIIGSSLFKIIRIFGLSSLALLSLPVYSEESVYDTINDKHDQLKRVHTKITVVDKNIGQLQNQQQALHLQLEALEKKIELQLAAMAELQRLSAQKEQTIAQTEKLIQTELFNLKQQKNGLKGQVLAAYQVGRHDRLKVVLNSQDPILSSRMIVYYDYLNKTRLQKVRAVESNAEQLKLLRQKQKNDVETLNQTLSQKQVEQAQLAENRQSRANILKQLHAKWVHDKNLLVQLQNDEKALKSLIGQLLTEAETLDDDIFGENPEDKDSQALESGNTVHADEQESTKADLKPGEKDVSSPSQEQSFSNQAFGGLKGQLPWPVLGRVQHENYGESSESRRDGILIAAGLGSPVRAVSKGKVAYAGLMRGYGMLVILNHGGGYMTIYAFNQNVYKKVGDIVNAGEVISSVGRSELQDTVGLYFEIRKSGSPLRPEAWLGR